MSAKNMFFSKDHDFTRAEERAFAREELAYNVTEDLLVIMEGMGVNKKELARRLGKSRSYVTQLLGGSRNMTLGSLSDICFALGFKPKIVLPVDKGFGNDLDWKTANKSSDDIEAVIVESVNIIDCREPRMWSSKRETEAA